MAKLKDLSLPAWGQQNDIQKIWTSFSLGTKPTKPGSKLRKSFVISVPGDGSCGLLLREPNKVLDPHSPELPEQRVFHLLGHSLL